MAIQKIQWDFSKMAARQGKQLMSLRLKDKSSAKMLWNDNAVDCYIVKNGKLQGAQGAKGNKNYIDKEKARILEKLQQFVEPGVNVFQHFINAAIKIEE